MLSCAKIIQIEKMAARVSIKELSPFDRNAARQVRIESGLTMAGLARLVGYSGKKPEKSIQGIENGYIIPSPNPQGENSRAYLLWLKEQGYNPFGLYFEK